MFPQNDISIQMDEVKEAIDVSVGGLLSVHDVSVSGPAYQLQDASVAASVQ